MKCISKDERPIISNCQISLPHEYAALEPIQTGGGGEVCWDETLGLTLTAITAPDSRAHLKCPKQFFPLCMKFKKEQRFKRGAISAERREQQQEEQWNKNTNSHLAESECGEKRLSGAHNKFIGVTV